MAAALEDMEFMYAKERKYRMIHSTLCMFVVLAGNGVSFLAGSGTLNIIALVCVWTAIALQWRILLKGSKKDRTRKKKREINELDDLLNYDNAKWKTFTFMKPIQRKWFKRWYDKWKGVTYVYLWKYSYNLEDDKHSFTSETKFPVTDRQMFTMKLKGYLNLTKAEEILPALEYLGVKDEVVK